MDFKNSILQEFLICLPKTKLSIRLSILSILLILLVGISILIIGINYFAINSILVASSKNHLSESTAKVAEQISNHISPLNGSGDVAYRMISKELIDPNKPEFAYFLYSLIVDHHGLVGAYWGDANGNWYWLNRIEGGFIQEAIIKGDGLDRVTRVYLDYKGKILKTESRESNELDPRTRPWYQQAKRNKDLTWVVYRFEEVGKQKTQLGVTSAWPVYDDQGKLRGVFGIDMLLNEIVNYIKSIVLTKNSYIFVVDSTGKLIATKSGHDNLLGFDSVYAIEDVSNSSWLQESFNIYKKMGRDSFIYSSGGKDYVSSYKEISGVETDSPWFVGVVTPVDDIIAPLKRSSLMGMLLAFLALSFGIIMASIFSTSLSTPIKRLAQDANYICQLKLEAVKHLFSRIKEIAEMADSFVRMKNALYSFQRYMPTALVKKLIVSNKIAEVGGETKELSLLFTDIQNFTRLSEGFDSRRLMRYLSEYFQSATKVIIDMSGTVDKYIGDGIMAFWGAPVEDKDHALHTCQAALNIQKALDELNAKWHRENKPELITRFGIDTGKVVVGNVGSDDRLSYTALGDHVNLASRLEPLNKVYGTTMMVSEFTYEKVKDYFLFRLLDKVTVKGKTRGVYIYELVGDLSDKEKYLELEKYNHEFYKAFSSYSNGYWEEALKLFNALEIKHPDDRVIKIFITRCEIFTKNPPLAWDGVWAIDNNNCLKYKSKEIV